jgi:hypothetical protein
MQAMALVGTGMVLVAYWLIQTERRTVRSPLYLSLNLGGSVLLLTVAVMDFVIGYMVLNAVWAGIAIYGYRRKHDS